MLEVRTEELSHGVGTHYELNELRHETPCSIDDRFLVGPVEPPSDHLLIPVSLL
jgi:hypothetical protein